VNAICLKGTIVTEKPNYPPIRRFVTGHDAKKTAKVIIHGPATNAKYPSPGTVSTMIWSTDRSPADISIGESVEDLGARIIGTAPPANGTRFAVIDFPPGNAPRMHRTETIDYVIVLEGGPKIDTRTAFNTHGMPYEFPLRHIPTMRPGVAAGNA